jgi:ribosomal protein S18 acetylase RimI-like enzyme
LLCRSARLSDGVRRWGREDDDDRGRRRGLFVRILRTNRRRSGSAGQRVAGEEPPDCGRNHGAAPFPCRPMRLQAGSAVLRPTRADAVFREADYYGVVKGLRCTCDDHAKSWSFPALAGPDRQRASAFVLRPAGDDDNGGMAPAAVTVDLVVRDLRHEDLAACAWTGSPTRLRYISAALGRRASGAVDYLAVCGPADLPLGLGGIDYRRRPDAGWLWQFVVHPAFRSCGIGTVLVRAAEDRIRRRGLTRAELGVEDANVRARQLYTRLGYEVTREQDEEWDVEDAAGRLVRRRAHCVVMRRVLELPPG